MKLPIPIKVDENPNKNPPTGSEYGLFLIISSTLALSILSIDS